MSKRYDINHYNNFGEFYREEVEPRIKKKEVTTNELNKDGEGSLTRFYASFNWKNKKFYARGDATLEAMKQGYLQYLKRGDDAFFSDDSKETVIALRSYTEINRFHVYIYKEKKKKVK